MWHPPIPYALVPTLDGESFRTFEGTQRTGLPLFPHPGAFGVTRAHHVHEGVDLYCPAGTPVAAVEAGEVVMIAPFTGPHAASPWWLDTYAIFVEGISGVVVYGEVTPTVAYGRRVAAGEVLAEVQTVLRRDKGRPRAMLHLELHASGARDAPEWLAGARPPTLRDPTPELFAACYVDRLGSLR